MTTFPECSTSLYSFQNAGMQLLHTMSDFSSHSGSECILKIRCKLLCINFVCIHNENLLYLMHSLYRRFPMTLNNTNNLLCCLINYNFNFTDIFSSYQ